MKSTVISDSVKKLIRTRIVKPQEIKGCSDSEISMLEARYHLSLPNLYKEFLREMGHYAGLFYQGTDLFYESLFDLRASAEELLCEDESRFQLPDDAFVFFMHHGYQFMYFRTVNRDDDPPVFNYLEGDGAPSQAYDNFSAFLCESVEDHIRILPNQGNKSVKTDRRKWRHLFRAFSTNSES
jgi:hypothetical protein